MNISELSSIATSLDDLTRRIAGHGEHQLQLLREDLANELFAVERSMTTAARRLTRIVDDASRARPPANN
jgi:hypothetical protein